MEGIPWRFIGALLQLLMLLAVISCNPATEQKQETEEKHHIFRRSLDLKEAYDLNNSIHLPSTQIPLHYKLQFAPNLEAATFQGCVQVTFISTIETETVTLHADKELVINRMELDVVDSTHLRSIDIIGKSRDADKDWLVITFTENLLIGVNYQLTLNFSGKLQTEQAEGFIRGSYQCSTTNETRWFAGIQTTGRSVFPCFDEPMFKTPFEVSVARKEGYNTLSNTLLRASEPDPEDASLVWDHFVVTPPISTFSIGVFVSEFLSITSTGTSHNNVALQVFGTPGKESELETTADLFLKFLTNIEDYLGMPYPFTKLDIVIVPQHSIAQKVDYAGLLIISESELTDEYAGYYLSTPVVKQWLHHMTSPAWWSSALQTTTLNKFIAKASNAMVPSWEIEMTWSLLYHYGSDNVTGHDDASSAVTGIWLLQMLNYTLSEETFRRGLLHFLEDRKYKSYTADDLWTALDSASSNRSTELSISQIVRPWLEYKRLPVITITRNYEAKTANIEQHVFIRSCPHNITGKDNYTWPIPIMYITEDNQDISSLRQVTWMNEKEITITDLPEADKFIVANPNDIGMYVVNYDQHNWAMIAQYLAEDPTRMAVDARNNLFHDAWILGYAGELDFNSVLNMTLFLAKERAYSVWENFLTMEDHLGRHLGGTQAGVKFNEYNVLLLTDLLVSLSELQQNEETAKLQRLAKRVLSMLSNVTYEEGAGTYNQWIENMNTSEHIGFKNLPGLCLIVKWGSNDEWDLCISKLLKHAATADPSWRFRFVGSIAGCSRHDEHFQRFLKVIFLENADLFTDRDRTFAISQLTGTYGGIKGMLTFLSENWDAVKHSLENKPDLWKQLVEEGTELFKTQEDFDKVVALYEERKEEFGVAKEVIERSIAKVGLEVEWSKRNHPVIEAWLDRKLAEMRN